MSKRINKRDILPLEVGFNLQTLFDKTDGKYKFRDNNFVPIMTIDPLLGTVEFASPLTLTTETTFTNTVNFDGATDFDGTNVFDGTSTFNAAVVFNGTVTKGVSVSSFVKELQLLLLSGGSSSGGSGSYFTDATSYQSLNPSEFIIDPDDYPGSSFFLEAVCRAGAFGDSLRTFSMELYDVTGAAAVTNSEITTTTTEENGSPAGGLVRLRGSVNFRGNLTAGDRTYILRYKSSDATRFVDLYEARLIIQY